MQFDRLKVQFIPPVGKCCGAFAPHLRGTAGLSAAGSPHRRELLQSLLVAALAAAAGWDNDAVAAGLPLERDLPAIPDFGRFRTVSTRARG
jgi:hypothetical protein